MSHASIAERIAFGRPLERFEDRVGSHVMPRPTTALVGRILLATLFMASGAGKLMDLSGTAGHMTEQGIPAAQTLALIAAFAEIAGGLSLLAGFLTRIGALGLIAFMIPTTLLLHDFWTFEGQEQRMQMVNFLKNLAIMGGLVLLVAYGPGRYSLDAKIRKPVET